MSPREMIEPTVTQDTVGAGNDPHEVYEHPAYGTITLTHPSGNVGDLFGSDVSNLGCVRISIQRAKLHRQLSNDWIHSEMLPLVMFEMTHAQFAAFLTGVGKGEGTPITLRDITDGTHRTVPAIKPIQTKHEILSREVEASAKKHLEGIQGALKKLNALIDSGKTGKTALKELTRELELHAAHLPGSLRFVLDQAQETLESATASAKIEVESFVSLTAKRLGLQSLQQLGRLSVDATAAALEAPQASSEE